MNQRPLLVDYLVGSVQPTTTATNSAAMSTTTTTTITTATSVPTHKKDSLPFPTDRATLDQAIIDNTVTFLFAGHETTSKTLLFLFFLLSRYPREQQRLCEELSSAFPLNTVPTLETVQTLPFLTATVREGLRLYSPAGVVLRMAKEDDVLPSGGVVRKGELVNINISGIHRNPAVWGADAHVFRPGRWLEPSAPEGSEQAVLRASPCSFLPFLHGPFNCVGRDFAMNELLLITAVLVRGYQWRRPPTAEAATSERTVPQDSKSAAAAAGGNGGSADSDSATAMVNSGGTTSDDRDMPRLRMSITLRPEVSPSVEFLRRME